MLIDQNVILIILFFVLVAFLVWIVILERRLGRFMQGKDGKSLEGTLGALQEKTYNLEKKSQETTQVIAILEKKSLEGIRAVSTVKFNAFGESGGKQSFATAFCNEKGGGVLLSAIYTRERTSVYSKPISEFSSEFELMPEEKEALQNAQKKIKKVSINKNG